MQDQLELILKIYCQLKVGNQMDSKQFPYYGDFLISDQWQRVRNLLQPVMNSYKTIDGHSTSSHVTRSGCITIYQKSNIIIHGIHIDDCKSSKNGMVKVLSSHAMFMTQSDSMASPYVDRSTYVWTTTPSITAMMDSLM